MKRLPVTPSLFAPDLPGTVRFYVEALGFRQTGSYKEDDGSEIWAEVALGESRIWFFSHPLDERPEPVFSGLIYVFVDDVDAVAKHLEGQVPFEWGPETQEWTPRIRHQRREWLLPCFRAGCVSRVTRRPASRVKAVARVPRSPYGHGSGVYKLLSLSGGSLGDHCELTKS